MVCLTQEEIDSIHEIWSKVSLVDITAHALSRVFQVYPWTTRLFTSFHGNFNADSHGVQEHAGKVAKALTTAIGDIKNINKNFAALSNKHQKLGVDTQNFKLLGQTFLVELAAFYKAAFTPQKHEAALKFFNAVAEGLSCQYH